MQDSFEARMQGQVPETVKTKSGKGWMICSIILLFLLVGVCVFGGMIIMKGDRDTNRLSEVENQLKEKDSKITEYEEQIADFEKQIADAPSKNSFANIDYKGLMKLLMGDYRADGDAGMGIEDIEFFNMTKDGKYLYGMFGLSPLLKSHWRTGGRAFVYKTLPDGKWQHAGVYTDGVDMCEKHSKAVLEILIDAGYGETWKCEVDGENVVVITAQEYYDQKYGKKSEKED